MRLTVCGTRPNGSLWNGDGTPALAGSRTEARMVELAGVSRDLFRLAVRYDNLYQRPDDPIRMFPRREAEAALVRADKYGSDAVVFLGTPARCVVRGARWLTWYPATNPPYSGRTMEVAFCPHPSGLNRWWNDEDNVEQARLFWSKIGEQL